MQDRFKELSEKCKEAFSKKMIKVRNRRLGNKVGQGMYEKEKKSKKYVQKI